MTNFKTVSYDDFDFIGFAKTCKETTAPCTIKEVGNNIPSLMTGDDVIYPYNRALPPFENMVIFYVAVVASSVFEGEYSEPKREDFNNLMFWSTAFYSFVNKGRDKGFDAETCIKYFKEVVETMGSIVSTTPPESIQEVTLEVIRQLRPLYEAECLLK